MLLLRLTASEVVPAPPRSAVDGGPAERMSAAWAQNGEGHGRTGCRCRQVHRAAAGMRQPGFQTKRRLGVPEGAARRARKMRKRSGCARKGQRQQSWMRPSAGEQASTEGAGAAGMAGGADEVVGPAAGAAAAEPMRSSRALRRLSCRFLRPCQPSAPAYHLPTLLLPSYYRCSPFCSFCLCFFRVRVSLPSARTPLIQVQRGRGSDCFGGVGPTERFPPSPFPQGRDCNSDYRTDC